MLKTEAKLATLIRRIVGRSAKVALGFPNMLMNSKGFTKPQIFLQLNQFEDTTAALTGSTYVAKNVMTDEKAKGFSEHRHGKVSILITVLSDDYAEIQEYRQRIIGEVLVFLSTVRALRISDPKDGNVDMVFKDVAANLQNFSIDILTTCKMPVYCGQIQFELNGFLHVCIKR
jgi:hypothetical protein